MRPRRAWALRAYESADKLQFEEVELPTLRSHQVKTFTTEGAKVHREESTGLGLPVEDKFQGPGLAGCGEAHQRAWRCAAGEHFDGAFADPSQRAERTHLVGPLKHSSNVSVIGL